MTTPTSNDHLLGRMENQLEQLGLGQATILEEIRSLRAESIEQALTLERIKAAIHLDNSTLDPISERVSNLESSMKASSRRWAWIGSVAGAILASVAAAAIIALIIAL